MWCFENNKRKRKNPNVNMEIIFPILILVVVKLEIRVWVGFHEMFNQNIYWKFQNEIKQGGGGLWVCRASRACGQAHPWVVLLRTSHFDFLGPIKI